MCQIAKEWIDRAHSAEDVYDKFISAYIALNFLYNERNQRCERDRMVNYLLDMTDCLKIEMPAAQIIGEYLAHPVINMTPRSSKKHQPQKVSDKRSLFEAIYQVRCNLFHGNKTLGDPRDRRLVAQGADVIIDILTRAKTRGCCF